MRYLTRLLVNLGLLLCLCGAVSAQTLTRPTLPGEVPPAPQSTVTVTATASNQRVRYVSIGEVQQSRLQVFSIDGRQVFDSDFRLGNLIDWRLTDQQGSHLVDGSYLYLVTVRDFSAHLTQKYGTAILEEGEVYLEQTTLDALTQSQSTSLQANRLTETLSPVDRLGAAGPGRNSTTTTATRTGESTATGTQPSSTTEDPKATAATTENISGTGTTNKVAKWTDGPAGVLGDSAISEVSGLTVFGQPLPLFPTAPSYHVVEIIAPGTKSPLVLAGGSGVMEFWKDATPSRAVSFGMAKPGTVATDDMVFSTFTAGAGAAGWAERLRITNAGNIGIGVAAPGFKLHVIDTGNAGLRVQTNAAGGTLASFGGNGDFEIDAPFNRGVRLTVKEDGRIGMGTNGPLSRLHLNVPFSSNPISAMAIDVQSFQTFSNAQASHFFRVKDIGAGGPSAFYIRGDGNVGVGTETPSEKLSVTGRVESTAGGFKFPDGSLQTIAANTTFTTYRTEADSVEIPSTASPASVLHLNLPPGTYLIWATIHFENKADYPAQTNNRDFYCTISGEPRSYIYSIGGNSARWLNSTLHSVLNVSSGGVDVTCHGFGIGQDLVFARLRRMTAVKIENVSVQ